MSDLPRDQLVDYYTQYDEQGRITIRHPIEMLRSKAVITRHLERRPMRVLDVGGAAGVYSLWLAGLGHSVDLIDLVPLHIEQARAQAQAADIDLNSIRLGDARALPFEDSTFDVVLLMGPLYHGVALTDRIAMLAESRRVLKAEGSLIAAAVSRYANLLFGFNSQEILDPDFAEMFDQEVVDGRHHPPIGRTDLFTKTHFHLPAELKSEISSAGFDVDPVIAVEGFSSCIQDLGSKINDSQYLSVLLRYLEKFETENSMMGHSQHLLAVARPM